MPKESEVPDTEREYMLYCPFFDPHLRYRHDNQHNYALHHKCTDVFIKIPHVHGDPLGNHHKLIYKRQQIEKIGCNRLAKATEGFNGADIESVVNETMELCFLEKKELTTDIILEIAKDTKSISKSCRNQIEDMEVLFD